MWRPIALPDLRIAPVLRGGGAAVCVVAYALLVHYVNASGQVSALGAILVLLPVLAAGLALARNPTSRGTGFFVLLAAGLVAWRAWPQLERHSALLFWLQDVGLMLFLLAGFGRTLRAGCKPLCVRFAEMMHGPLTPAHAAYARQVTLAWTLFFAAMATVSSLLFFLAPLAVWSAFVNFLTLPLVALMFVAEFLVRRRLLAEAAGSPFAALRTYLHRSAGTE
jgi:uncharacterized membrane protein